MLSVFLFISSRANNLLRLSNFINKALYLCMNIPNVLKTRLKNCFFSRVYGFTWICHIIKMATLNMYEDPYYKVHGLPDVIAMNYLNLMLQDTLIITKHVQQAAIIDIASHKIKACSIGLKLDDEVITYFMTLFKDPMGIREHGINYEDKNYRCVRAERHAIYAKLGKRGLVLVQTKTLMIVASFSENMLGSICVEAVEHLADYFRKKNM